MARSNKYASLNFNDIYEKKLNNNGNNNFSSSSSTAKSFSSAAIANPANKSKTILSNSRIHGHMLVLTRPTPKPISIPQAEHKQSNNNHNNNNNIPNPVSSTPSNQIGQAIESDSISLRPQGRTGSGPPLVSPSSLPSPVSPLPPPVKTDRFVPPHLRPGFVGREEKPGSEFVKGGPVGAKPKTEFGGRRPGQVQGQGSYCPSPNRYGKDERPKSGGGYERVSRGDGLASSNRPGSSGTRPSSSG